MPQVQSPGFPGHPICLKLEISPAPASSTILWACLGVGERMVCENTSTVSHEIWKFSDQQTKLPRFLTVTPKDRKSGKGRRDPGSLAPFHSIIFLIIGTRTKTLTYVSCQIHELYEETGPWERKQGGKRLRGRGAQGVLNCLISILKEIFSCKQVS